MSTERKKESPLKPIALSADEKRLVEKYIGTQSKRHGEFYLRSEDGEEHEIWYLARSALLIADRKEAIADMMENYELSEEEATAVYLFCRAFPETAKESNKEYTNPKEYADIFPGRRVVQPDPLEVLNLKP